MENIARSSVQSSPESSPDSTPPSSPGQTQPSRRNGGRRKIKIAPIQNNRSRQVTFLKRKNGILKKAHELSILSGCNIAVAIFNNDNGKLYEYFNPSAEETFNRYAQYSGMSERRRSDVTKLEDAKGSCDIPNGEPHLATAAKRAADMSAIRHAHPENYEYPPLGRPQVHPNVIVPPIKVRPPRQAAHVAAAGGSLQNNIAGPSVRRQLVHGQVPADPSVETKVPGVAPCANVADNSHSVHQAASMRSGLRGNMAVTNAGGRVSDARSLHHPMFVHTVQQVEAQSAHRAPGGAPSFRIGASTDGIVQQAPTAVPLRHGVRSMTPEEAEDEISACLGLKRRAPYMHLPERGVVDAQGRRVRQKTEANGSANLSLRSNELTEQLFPVCATRSRSYRGTPAVQKRTSSILSHQPCADDTFRQELQAVELFLAMSELPPLFAPPRQYHPVSESPYPALGTGSENVLNGDEVQDSRNATCPSANAARRRQCNEGSDDVQSAKRQRMNSNS